ncbi:MAG: rRNA maturation RNase YbeY [Chloroflexota bacterium]
MNEVSVETALLERAANQALQHANAGPQAEVTLVLSDEAQLHELNRQFLGVDAPTDVLAFPAGEVDPDSQALYLGDVIISYPRAQAQAASAGHTLEAELQLLVVHGTLHLLGYDHASPEEKVAMWAVQADILHQLGVTIAALPE